METREATKEGLSQAAAGRDPASQTDEALAMKAALVALTDEGALEKLLEIAQIAKDFDEHDMERLYGITIGINMARRQQSAAV
jgi:hypothetical protein